MTFEWLLAALPAALPRFPHLCGLLTSPNPVTCPYPLLCCPPLHCKVVSRRQVSLSAPLSLHPAGCRSLGGPFLAGTMEICTVTGDTEGLCSLQGQATRDRLGCFLHETYGSWVTASVCLMLKVCFPNDHAVFESKLVNWLS